MRAFTLPLIGAMEPTIETETSASARRNLRDRVADSIREYIRSHILRPGDRLPSEREFADEFHVTHFAVRMANETLIREGWITREHGRGTFVGPRAIITSDNVVPPATTTTRTVGYLAVGTELVGYTLKRYRQMETLARAENMRLIFGSAERADRRPIPQNFIDEMVSGFVVDGDLDAAYLNRLKDIPMPIVVAGNHPVVAGLTSIRMDVSALHDQIVQALAGAGRKFIWISMEPLRLFYTREILAGYRQGLRRSGMSPELIVFLDEHDPGNLVRQVAACRDLFGPRQAIIHGDSALPLLSALEAAKVDLDRLDIVAVTPPSGRTPNCCSEIWFPLDEIGQQAPRLLFELLRGKKISSVVFEPRVSMRRIDSHAVLRADWKPRIVS